MWATVIAVPIFLGEADPVAGGRALSRGPKTTTVPGGLIPEPLLGAVFRIGPFHRVCEVCHRRPPTGDSSAWGSVLWAADRHLRSPTPRQKSGKGRHCVRAPQSVQTPAVYACFPETSLCSPENDVFLLPPGLENANLEIILKELTPVPHPTEVLIIRPGVWPGHRHLLQVLQVTRTCSRV